MNVSKARASASTQDEDDRPFIGGLVLTVVTRVHESIRGGGTASVGEVVDEFLVNAAKEGREVQKVEFHMEPEQWALLAPNYARAVRND